MTLKTILIAMATVAGLSSFANASVYDFKFTDTIASANTPGITVGDTFTLVLRADNGNSSLTNQTWNLSDLRGFTITAGSYSASYSRVFEWPTSGNFVTDSTGLLSSVQFYGTSNLSVNSDNFGTWTADTVFGNAIFDDYFGRDNGTTVSNFGDASKWTITADSGVPEPATWTMLLLGFGILGFALRSRRESVTAAA